MKRSKTRNELNKLSERALKALNKKKMTKTQWNALGDWINEYENVIFRYWDFCDELLLTEDAPKGHRLTDLLGERLAQRCRNLHKEKDGLYIMERV